MDDGVSRRDKNTQSLWETPSSSRRGRLASQCFPEILQQAVEHFVCAAPPVELPQQPRPPRGRHPDTLHGDLRGTALEVELEERFRAAAVDDLDPGVRGGGLVLDHFDDGVGFAALALEVQPVAVTFAPTGGAPGDGQAGWEPPRPAAPGPGEVGNGPEGEAD